MKVAQVLEVITLTAEDNLRIPPKKYMDPNAAKFFKVEWANEDDPYLADGVVIDESEWNITVAPDEGLTIIPGEESNTTTDAIVKVTGPTPGVAYWLTNHCAFSDGTEDDQSIIIIGKEM